MLSVAARRIARPELQLVGSKLLAALVGRMGVAERGARCQAQLVKKTRSVVRTRQNLEKYLARSNRDEAPDSALLVAAVTEALDLKEVRPDFWTTLKKGPLLEGHLKAMDMKTLTFLYHSVCAFVSQKLIPADDSPPKAQDLIERIQEEILSLERFLQFDNRSTISRVVLGMAMQSEHDRVALRKMSYKVMSRVKRLHPETLVDVLYSWAKLKWNKKEDLALVSEETLMHKEFLSSHHMAKSIWSWAQLGNQFDDHVGLMLMQLVDSKKLQDLTAQEVAMVLSSARTADHADNLHKVLHHFFNTAVLSECDTTSLIRIFIAMEHLLWDNRTEWHSLKTELGSFRRLSAFQPPDFLSVWETCLKPDRLDAAFLDRLSFEMAQPEQLPKFSVGELVGLTKAASASGLKNIVQILAEEMSRRTEISEDVDALISLWVDNSVELQIRQRYLSRYRRSPRPSDSTSLLMR